MPVEFLSDAQVAAYGTFPAVVGRRELERFFFLDDEDLALVGRRRQDRYRLGFGVQLVTVRYLGVFLAEPTVVPAGVVAWVAEQLGINDVGCLSGYAERRQTPFEHAWEIREALGLREFPAAREQLAAWVSAQAWSTVDGPVALFDGAVLWLREQRVLLPGVTVLARMVASLREDAAARLFGVLHGLLRPGRARVLEQLVAVAGGDRTSTLERLRRGPTQPTGRALAGALERVEEIAALGFVGTDLSSVPQTKVLALARYGMAASATVLRRHPRERGLATLLATVVHVHAVAVDDALELLDLLMTSHLWGPVRRIVEREHLRQYPRLFRDSAALAAAVTVLLEATALEADAVAGPQPADRTADDVEGDVEGGSPAEGLDEAVGLEAPVPMTVAQLWELIDARVPRARLRAAVASVGEVTPELGADPDAEVREGLLAKVATVRPFLALPCSCIEFQATPAAAAVLAAMVEAGPVLATAGPMSAAAVHEGLVTGSWRRLVFHRPGLAAGTADKRAYAMCVLEQFHRLLRHREIYAPASTRWGDPRARLLDGPRWEQARPVVLAALRLPEDPAELLAGHATGLDTRYRELAAGFDGTGELTVDAGGRLHVQALDAVEEPASLLDLRARVASMLPQVDVGELILEVMGWHPGMLAAFTAASGGEPRMADLPVVIAAALTAHALNIGYSPIVAAGQLSRARLSHVDTAYLRSETYAAANTPLIEAQADVGLAQSWGGGLVAAVDGMRFVVTVTSTHARPNSRYFGRDRGATWLNLVNDQAAGLAGMVVPGTPRDSLHVLDLLYRQQGGPRPEVLVTDMSSATDVVFALVHLLGRQYRPAPADLPDERLWRADPKADYGPLNTAARGRLDLDRCSRHWPDMLRVVASIHTGEVLASQVMRVLQRDGTLTPLVDAFAHYGRIFKTRHLLSYVADADYRRDIKSIRNLQEGRHSLARHLCHGKQGQLHRAYQHGMEEQLGALGLVLNCVVLWNTVYTDRALTELRETGMTVHDADIARLSPFGHAHINVHGTYTFAPLAGGTPWRRWRDDSDGAGARSPT